MDGSNKELKLWNIIHFSLFWQYLQFSLNIQHSESLILKPLHLFCCHKECAKGKKSFCRRKNSYFKWQKLQRWFWAVILFQIHTYMHSLGYFMSLDHKLFWNGYFWGTFTEFHIWFKNLSMQQTKFHLFASLNWLYTKNLVALNAFGADTIYM